MHIVVKITAFCLAPLVATLAASKIAFAQGSMEVQRVDGAHLDYTRYFASPDVESRERAALQNRSDRFVESSSCSLKTTAVALKEGDALERAWMLHAEYCQLRSADDADDKSAADCETASENQLASIKAFVEKQLEGPEFASASDADLSRMGLAPYRYLLARARDDARHRLPPAERKLMSSLVDPLLTGWSDRYDALVRQINADVKKAQAAEPAAGKQSATNPSASKAREATYRARIDAYQKHRDAIALTLLDTVRLESAVALAQHYKSAPERKYAGRLQLSQEQVRRMLEMVQKHSDVLRAYQQVRADRAATLIGNVEVHSWDLTVSSGYVPPNLPFEQARKVMVEAVRPLGKEYLDRFAGLFDPANGALDMNGGSRRQPGGFSVGFPSVPAALYMYAFDGSIESMDTAIHEGGHAIHRKLINDAGVSGYYANGPNFLSEAYAIFNEFLLLHHLMEQSKSLEERTYYQERLLYEVAFQIFTSAEEGELEEALYDGVKAGKLRMRTISTN